MHKGQYIIARVLMDYGYIGVDENSKVRVITKGIKTNALDAFMASVLASPEMQGDFDISETHFLDFMTMTPSIQKNVTAKVSFVNRSGGGRVYGRGSDRGFGMPADFDVQAAMVTIKNKYFHGYERVYFPMAE